MVGLEDLIRLFERRRWLEREMFDIYSTYTDFLKNERLLNAFKGLRDDEARHINMIEQILSILKNKEQDS